MHYMAEGTSLENQLQSGTVCLCLDEVPVSHFTTLPHIHADLKSASAQHVQIILREKLNSKETQKMQNKHSAF